MNELSNKNQFLRKRRYQTELLQKPDRKLVFEEWKDTLNFFKNKEALGVLSWLAYYLFTFLLFLGFIYQVTSLQDIFVFVLFFLIQANIFHTFWYHRYASHKSYQFSNLGVANFFKWINPLAIKEEIYVIPHFVHHRFSDSPQDPYGPHIGALASFLSTESQFYFNRNMSAETYNTCLKLLDHIPAKYNDWQTFKEKGTFEPNLRYVVRILFMLVFWYFIFVVLFNSLGCFLAFFGSSFFFISILRDFNYRGHDEHIDLEKSGRIDKKSKAVNQLIYGFIASEWHENHHRYSSSAKSGFESWQLDLSFLLTLLLYKLRIVKSYRDSHKSYTRDRIKQEVEKNRLVLQD